MIYIYNLLYIVGRKTRKLKFDSILLTILQTVFLLHFSTTLVKTVTQACCKPTASFEVPLLQGSDSAYFGSHRSAYVDIQLYISYSLVYSSLSLFPCRDRTKVAFVLSSRDCTGERTSKVLQQEYTLGRSIPKGCDTIQVRQRGGKRKEPTDNN